MTGVFLTLFVSQRLLQHGDNDGVIQDEVSEVTVRRGGESGIFDQRVLIQQTAGRGGAAGRRERTQHLHYTGTQSSTNQERRTYRERKIKSMAVYERRSP